MRKITILVASILAMVGCAENSKINNENLRPRITMSVDASKSEVEDTRIELASGVYDMLWEENDKIGLFIAGTGEKAVFEMSSLGDDRKSARFSGEIYEPETIDSYYAYYPSNTPFGGSIASFVLPSETTGATAPMLVAMHEETTIDNVQLIFKPVTALLELTLGFAADKVVIESNNGESLAGVYSYNIATGTGNSISGSTSVTLTAPAAGTHYLYMPDVTLAKGYKVTVVVGDNQMIKTVGYNTGKTFVAGEVTPLEISTFEPVSVTLGDVKTSYSYYTAGDSATANSVDGSTVYFTGASTFSGVSSTLVEECGVYCGSKKLVGTISGKSFTATNISGLSWGTHSVCAYVKVNGVEYKSASKSVYITGLPYEADWRSKDYSDWTFLSSNTTGQDRAVLHRR